MLAHRNGWRAKYGLSAMTAIGAIGVVLAAMLLSAPASLAQPTEAGAADEGVEEREAAPEPDDTADLELRLTKQILLLQRQINQLTKRINELESRTEP